VSEPADRVPEEDEPILEVRELTVHHGQLRALDHISLRVFRGEVYAIIGANGAGKSTLLRTIAGLHQPTEGSIRYDGQDVTRIRPERRAISGIVMVPEGRRLFGSLTVEENLQVGATYARKGPWTIERVYELFSWMKDRRAQRTEQLSGGEHIHRVLGADRIAGIGGIHRDAVGFDRLFERNDLRDLAVHALVGVLSLLLRGPSRGLKSRFGRIPGVSGLADLGLRGAGGEQRYRHADLPQDIPRIDDV